MQVIHNMTDQSHLDFPYNQNGQQPIISFVRLSNTTPIARTYVYTCRVVNSRNTQI